MSLYDDLGVDAQASIDEINQAYRKAAKDHHPDTGGDADAFARISHAVAILRDPARRAEYDRSGRENFQEDSPDARAVAVLTRTFGQALQAFAEQKMPTTQDLMAVVRRKLQEDLTRQRNEREKAIAAQRRNSDAHERLTHKGGGPDILGQMLADQAKNIAQAVVAMEEMEGDISRALEMAADWDWRPDEVPTYASAFSFMAAGDMPDNQARYNAMMAEITPQDFLRPASRGKKGGVL
jgi:curved DNA-binding protein CbpA